jgi:hypothetical protein
MGMLCLAYVGSNALTKLSLKFVTLPTMIVLKSCKLVAVMLGSKLVLGKVYSKFEYGIAIGLVLGMVSFSLADMQGSDPQKENSLVGIAVLVIALCFDSMLGNFQENVQKSKLCSRHSLMFIQSLASATILLLWCLVTGELWEGLNHCWRDPRVLFTLLAWALTNMAGIYAHYH